MIRRNPEPRKCGNPAFSSISGFSNPPSRGANAAAAEMKSELESEPNAAQVARPTGFSLDVSCVLVQAAGTGEGRPEGPRRGCLGRDELMMMLALR